MKRIGLALACACAVAAIGCSGGGKNSSSSSSGTTGHGSSSGSTTTSSGGSSSGSSGTSGIVVDHSTVSQTMGTDGGVLAHPSGAELDVPAGALASPVDLSMTGIDPPAASALGGTAVGQGFDMGPEGQQFLIPVTITVPIDESLIPAGMTAADLKLFTAPQGTTNFAALDTTYDATRHTLSAQTTHFSSVVPAAPSNPNPLFVSTTSLPSGQVGYDYGTQYIDATGGNPDAGTGANAYTWTSVTGAPPGLTLNSVAGRGEIFGAPYQAGTYAWTVQVADNGSPPQRVQKTFTVQVTGQNPAPVLSSLDTTSAPAGSADLTLTLSGDHFVPGSVAYFDQNTALTTSYVTVYALTAIVPSTLMVTAGTHTITVVSPAPGGGTSNGLSFDVVATGPTITALTPSSVPAGSIDTQIDVTGTNFDNTCYGFVGGNGLSTSFVSATDLQVVVPSTLLTTPGSLQLGVYCPSNNGFSNYATLTITNADGGVAAPLINTVSPPAVYAGQTTTVDVFGSGFTVNDVVYSGALSNTLVSSWVAPDHMQVEITASLTAGVGFVSFAIHDPVSGLDSNTATVQVLNADGGAASGDGGSSGALSISSLSPSSITQGTSNNTIDVLGSGFEVSSNAYVDGVLLNGVAFNSATWITLYVGTDVLQAAGTHTVQVVNTSGAVSNLATFTVTGTNPVPTLQYSSWNFPVGSGDNELQLLGSGFIFDSQVFVDGAQVASSYQYGSTLYASLSAALFTQPGTHWLIVRNPGPGGGDSNAMALQVLEPDGGQPPDAGPYVATDAGSSVYDGGGVAPFISGLSPSSVYAGSTTLIDVYGQGFATTDVVYAGTFAITATYLGPNQLEATVPSAALNSQGTTLISVHDLFTGLSSNTSPLTVVTPDAGTSSDGGFPVPTISNVSPGTVPLGATYADVSIYGTGILDSTQVLVNGTFNPVTYTYVSPYQLDVTIPSSLLATTGTLSFQLWNPSPGGGYSGAYRIVVAAPVDGGSGGFDGGSSGGTDAGAPNLLQASPNPITAGADTTVTISGTGLDVNDTWYCNGTQLQVTYFGIDYVNVLLPGTVSQGAQVLYFQAISPGGAFSNNLVVQVIGGSGADGGGSGGNDAGSALVLNSSYPSTLYINEGDTLLDLYGANFNGGTLGCSVEANSNTISSSTIDSTHMQCTVPGTLLTGGKIDVWVVCAGTASNHLTFSPQPLPTTDGGNPMPTVTVLDPNTVPQGSPDTLVTVNGTGFLPSTTIVISGVAGGPLSSRFISDTQIVATVPAQWFASAGTVSLFANNPGPGGGTSTLADITVTATTGGTDGGTGGTGGSDGGSAGGVDAGYAFTVNLQTTEALVGSSDLYVLGQGYPLPSDIMVNINGNGEAVTLLGGGDQVRFLMSAALFSKANTLPIYFYSSSNPASRSAPLTFNVVSSGNPVPVLATLAMADGGTSVPAGSGPVDVVLTGSWLDQFGSVYLQENGASATGTDADGGYAVYTLSSVDLLTAGTRSISVINPAPGGGASAALSFTVSGTNPSPSITSTSPGSIGQGSSGVNVTFTGTGFLPTTTVSVNGQRLGTCSSNPTSCTAYFPASLLASSGSLDVVLANPAPGGGSALTTFIVCAGNALPTLSAVSPGIFAVGSATQTVSVTGTGFATGAALVETTTNTVLTPLSINATSMKVDIPQSLKTSAGTLTFIVRNPSLNSCGDGGDSNPVNVPVGYTPAITSTNPSTLQQQPTSPTVTLSGTNLDQSATLGPPSAYVFGPAGSTYANSYLPGDGTVQVYVPASQLSAAGTIYVWIDYNGLSSNHQAISVF